MRLERWRYSVPLRVRGLFRRGRLETDLTDEFRDHLERDRCGLQSAPGWGGCPVSPGYFEALRVRIVDDRPLAIGDIATAPPVAVVNRSFARRYLDGILRLASRFRATSAAAQVSRIVIRLLLLQSFVRYYTSGIPCLRSTT